MSDQSPIARALSLFGNRQRQLAEACGVSQSAISQALKAGRASGELAIKIEIATDGAVTCRDLRPDLWPAHAQHGASA